MGIIQELKNLLGYSGSDLDIVFAILGIYLVFMFMSCIFSIFTLLFGGNSWKR